MFENLAESIIACGANCKEFTISWTLRRFYLFELKLFFKFQLKMDPLEKHLTTARCCACLNLRRGGIVLGCVTIFLCVLGIFLFIISPLEFHEQSYKHHLRPETALFCCGMYQFWILDFLNLLQLSIFLYWI